MGARLSASSGSSSPDPPITAGPPPSIIPTDVGPGNPGDFEEIGKKVKEQLMPTCIEGAKVVLQKGLSNHLQTNHTLTLGSSTQPSQWQFGATYVGDTKIGENDMRPILIGDMSSCGNFTSLFLHQRGPWRMKINAQTQKTQWVGYQGTVDYAGQDFTASTTVANPDIFSGSGIVVLQYLQSLTRRFALGSELVYQMSGGMQGAMVSVGGYYKADMWEASARIGLHSWNVNYYQKLDRNFLLLASLDGSLMQGETSAAVGCKLELGRLTVKGKVSSHGVVSSTVEKRLDPLPASLILSGQLNHWTDESKFGIGILVG